ncbi:MAG: hypothetical protein GY870_07310 [archaeon]|nr:hypothetical protein [archaeon]
MPKFKISKNPKIQKIMKIPDISHIDKKKRLIASIIIFCIGVSLMIAGTFNPEENLPIRFSFNTENYPKYVIELNDFFNRTEVTSIEDAQNKLIEDYSVAGYVIVPKSTMPAEGYPVVIWMHGFAMNAEIQINYPRQLAKSGFLSVVLNQPGHGLSGGYWDMSLSILLGVYSSIDWLVNDSDYTNIVDRSRIGVSGHSLGGIATTRVGLFDNWTNPNTGNIIGTGLINSYCAVFCWDHLGNMAEQLMENYLGIEDVWNHPTITQVLSQWRWLSNHDPTILDTEVEIRSVTNYINHTNMPNYCLIIGDSDQLVSIQSQCYIMSNATVNSSGEAQVSSSTIYKDIMINSNHTWDYGNMSNDTARRLVLVPGVEHVREAVSHDVIQNMTYFFNEAMECNGITVEVPTNFQIQFFIKSAGWIISLIAAFLAIFPLLSYLTITNKKKIVENIEEVESEVESEVKLKDKNRKTGKFKDYFILYAILFAVFMGISGIINLNSITHFWILDVIIPKFLLGGVFTLIAVVLILFFEKKQNKIGLANFIDLNNPSNLIEIGFKNTLKDNIKDALYPIIAILIPITIFNISAWIFQVPLLLPRPFEIAIYIDVVILFCIFLLYNFTIEFVFRGIYLRKSIMNNLDESQKSKRFFRSLILGGIFVGLGFGTSMIISFYALFSGIRLIIFIIGAWIAFGFLFGFIGYFSLGVYKKTGSVVSSTVFNAFIMTLMISGKLILTYA